jgi:hypothetical protein
MVGGGLPPERWFLIMFCKRRIKKKRKNLLDTLETAANIIRTFKNYVQRKQYIFLGGTLILQSEILGVNAHWNWMGGGKWGEYKNGPQNTILQH